MGRFAAGRYRDALFPVLRAGSEIFQQPGEMAFVTEIPTFRRFFEGCAAANVSGGAIQPEVPLIFSKAQAGEIFKES